MIPKYNIGDKVILNQDEPNEMHGTVEEVIVGYYVRWDKEYYQSLNSPVGPYMERLLS